MRTRSPQQQATRPIYLRSENGNLGKILISKHPKWCKVHQFIPNPINGKELIMKYPIVALNTQTPNHQNHCAPPQQVNTFPSFLKPNPLWLPWSIKTNSVEEYIALQKYQTTSSIFYKQREVEKQMLISPPTLGAHNTNIWRNHYPRSSSQPYILGITPIENCSPR